MSTADGLALAVVGPSGLLGREILDQLHRRHFPVGSMRRLGSLRTAGATLSDTPWNGKIDPLGPEAFAGVDLVLFAAGPRVAGEFAPIAAAGGTAVIDLSSRHRLDPLVPLAVPEVNVEAIGEWRERGIVASPCAVATGMSVVLGALASEVELTRVVCSTYQSVAGAGRVALGAFGRESIGLLAGKPRPTKGPNLAFDCVPSIGGIEPGGGSAFETQCGAEVRRILGRPGLPIHLTAVRVPAFFGLGMSLHLEAAEPVDGQRVRELLLEAPGILLHDGEGVEAYRTLTQVGTSEATHVGRVRTDTEDPATLDLWVTLDGMVKGTALNAVQIAEILVRDHL